MVVARYPVDPDRTIPKRLDRQLRPPDLRLHLIELVVMGKVETTLTKLPRRGELVRMNTPEVGVEAVALSTPTMGLVEAMAAPVD